MSIRIIHLACFICLGWLCTTVTSRVISKRAAFYIANETMCIVDGEVFRNGDPVPTDDHCEKCTCRPPGFSCVLRDCEIKPGCKAVRRDGECCPEYVCGCVHSGKLYEDGELIRDIQNPCYTCRCHGSSISCVFADCLFRGDCAPEYVNGECCPRYDHCPPLSTSPPVTVFTASPTMKDGLIESFYNLTTSHLEKFTGEGTRITIEGFNPTVTDLETTADSGTTSSYPDDAKVTVRFTLDEHEPSESTTDSSWLSSVADWLPSVITGTTEEDGNTVVAPSTISVHFDRIPSTNFDLSSNNDNVMTSLSTGAEDVRASLITGGEDVGTSLSIGNEATASHSTTDVEDLTTSALTVKKEISTSGTRYEEGVTSLLMKQESVSTSVTEDGREEGSTASSETEQKNDSLLLETESSLDIDSSSSNTDEPTNVSVETESTHAPTTGNQDHPIEKSATKSVPTEKVSKEADGSTFTTEIFEDYSSLQLKEVHSESTSTENRLEEGSLPTTAEADDSISTETEVQYDSPVASKNPEEEETSFPVSETESDSSFTETEYDLSSVFSDDNQQDTSLQDIRTISHMEADHEENDSTFEPKRQTEQKSESAQEKTIAVSSTGFTQDQIMTTGGITLEDLRETKIPDKEEIKITPNTPGALETISELSNPTTEGTPSELVTELETPKADVNQENLGLHTTIKDYDGSPSFSSSQGINHETTTADATNSDITISSAYAEETDSGEQESENTKKTVDESSSAPEDQSIITVSTDLGEGTAVEYDVLGETDAVTQTLADRPSNTEGRLTTETELQGMSSKFMESTLSIEATENRLASSQEVEELSDQDRQNDTLDRETDYTVEDKVSEVDGSVTREIVSSTGFTKDHSSTSIDYTDLQTDRNSEHASTTGIVPTPQKPKETDDPPSRTETTTLQDESSQTATGGQSLTTDFDKTISVAIPLKDTTQDISDSFESSIQDFTNIKLGDQPHQEDDVVETKSSEAQTGSSDELFREGSHKDVFEMPAAPVGNVEQSSQEADYSAISITEGSDYSASEESDVQFFSTTVESVDEVPGVQDTSTFNDGTQTDESTALTHTGHSNQNTATSKESVSFRTDGTTESAYITPEIKSENSDKLLEDVESDLTTSAKTVRYSNGTTSSEKWVGPSSTTADVKHDENDSSDEHLQNQTQPDIAALTDSDSMDDKRYDEVFSTDNLEKIEIKVISTTGLKDVDKSTPKPPATDGIQKSSNTIFDSYTIDEHDGTESERIDEESSNAHERLAEDSQSEPGSEEAEMLKISTYTDSSSSTFFTKSTEMIHDSQTVSASTQQDSDIKDLLSALGNDTSVPVVLGNAETLEEILSDDLMNTESEQSALNEATPTDKGGVTADESITSSSASSAQTEIVASNNFESVPVFHDGNVNFQEDGIEGVSYLDSKDNSFASTAYESTRETDTEGISDFDSTHGWTFTAVSETTNRELQTLSNEEDETRALQDIKTTGISLTESKPSTDSIVIIKSEEPFEKNIDKTSTEKPSTLASEGTDNIKAFTEGNGDEKAPMLESDQHDKTILIGTVGIAEDSDSLSSEGLEYQPHFLEDTSRGSGSATNFGTSTSLPEDGEMHTVNEIEIPDHPIPTSTQSDTDNSPTAVIENMTKNLDSLSDGTTFQFPETSTSEAYIKTTIDQLTTTNINLINQNVSNQPTDEKKLLSSSYRDIAFVLGIEELDDYDYYKSQGEHSSSSGSGKNGDEFVKHLPSIESSTASSSQKDQTSTEMSSNKDKSETIPGSSPSQPTTAITGDGTELDFDDQNFHRVPEDSDSDKRSLTKPIHGSSLKHNSIPESKDDQIQLLSDDSSAVSTHSVTFEESTTKKIQIDLEYQEKRTVEKLPQRDDSSTESIKLELSSKSSESTSSIFETDLIDKNVEISLSADEDKGEGNSDRKSFTEIPGDQINSETDFKFASENSKEVVESSEEVFLDIITPDDISEIEDDINSTKNNGQMPPIDHSSISDPLESSTLHGSQGMKGDNGTSFNIKDENDIEDINLTNAFSIENLGNTFVEVLLNASEEFLKRDNEISTESVQATEENNTSSKSTAEESGKATTTTNEQDIDVQNLPAEHRQDGDVGIPNVPDTKIDPDDPDSEYKDETVTEIKKTTPKASFFSSTDSSEYHDDSKNIEINRKGFVTSGKIQHYVKPTGIAGESPSSSSSIDLVPLFVMSTKEINLDVSDVASSTHGAIDLIKPTHGGMFADTEEKTDNTQPRTDEFQPTATYQSDLTSDNSTSEDGELAPGSEVEHLTTLGESQNSVRAMETSPMRDTYHFAHSWLSANEAAQDAKTGLEERPFLAEKESLSTTESISNDNGTGYPYTRYNWNSGVDVHKSHVHLLNENNTADESITVEHDDENLAQTTVKATVRGHSAQPISEKNNEAEDLSESDNLHTNQFNKKESSESTEIPASFYGKYSETFALNSLEESINSEPTTAQQVKEEPSQDIEEVTKESDEMTTGGPATRRIYNESSVEYAETTEDDNFEVGRSESQLTTAVEPLNPKLTTAHQADEQPAHYIEVTKESDEMTTGGPATRRICNESSVEYAETTAEDNSKAGKSEVELTTVDELLNSKPTTLDIGVTKKSDRITTGASTTRRIHEESSVEYVETSDDISEAGKSVVKLTTADGWLEDDKGEVEKNMYVPEVYADKAGNIEEIPSVTSKADDPSVTNKMQDSYSGFTDMDSSTSDVSVEELNKETNGGTQTISGGLSPIFVPSLAGLSIAKRKRVSDKHDDVITAGLIYNSAHLLPGFHSFTSKQHRGESVNIAIFAQNEPISKDARDSQFSSSASTEVNTENNSEGLGSQEVNSNTKVLVSSEKDEIIPQLKSEEKVSLSDEKSESAVQEIASTVLTDSSEVSLHTKIPPLPVLLMVTSKYDATANVADGTTLIQNEHTTEISQTADINHDEGDAKMENDMQSGTKDYSMSDIVDSIETVSSTDVIMDIKKLSTHEKPSSDLLENVRVDEKIPLIEGFAVKSGDYHAITSSLIIVQPEQSDQTNTTTNTSPGSRNTVILDANTSAVQTTKEDTVSSDSIQLTANEEVTVSYRTDNGHQRR